MLMEELREGSDYGTSNAEIIGSGDRDGGGGGGGFLLTAPADISRGGVCDAGDAGCGVSHQLV